MRKQETPCYGLLIVILYMTSQVIGQGSVDINQLCESEGTDCKTCLQVDPSCSWCEEIREATLTKHIKRCKTYSENLKTCLNSTGGVSDKITFPKTELVINKNENFTVAGPDFFEDSSNEGKTVLQMRPQNLTVKLRKNQPFKLNITFKKVIDFPLDIYYVMDLSNSMNDDLDTLKNLGNKLFDDIKSNVTKNIQLGFGSFVDKVLMPYASTVEEQLNNPCVNNKNYSDCAPPFGFRHQLAITGNATKFAKEIDSTKISGNIDVPEGCFDALMQIAVCNQIKWRPDSTRVILLSTDASPHLANDGKLAAILEANDMKCHLETNKNVNKYLNDSEAVLYSKSKTMDYPSLGQLKVAFKDHKIHSIWAVTKEVFPLYEEIEKILDNAYVSELTSDSSNIIPLINQTYSKLKGRLSLDNPTAPEGVSIKSSVVCPRESSNDTKSRLLCDGIEIGDEVVFEFEFLLEECPSEQKTDKVILKSSSLQDEVIINIEYLCECECEKQGTSRSDQCNSNGGLTCGVCACDPGKEGSLCQCDSTVNGDSVKLGCARDKNKEVYCENNGVCECGKCERCVPPYTGEFCHCKTTGCPSNSDGVCGGADKGYCNNCDDDKKCECYGNFTIKQTDKTCSCDPEKCKGDPLPNAECNGRGKCECDTCVCDHPKIYSGKYCGNCIDPSCTGIDRSCKGSDIRDCALCKSERDNCNHVCKTSAQIIFQKVPKFPDCSVCNRLSKTTECDLCEKHDHEIESCTDEQSDGCSAEFKIYWLTSSQFRVYVKEQDRENDCPKPIEPIMIVLPVVGGILLLGLFALIAWKFYVTQRDKRQYMEFLEEEKKRKWTKGENPIWKQPEQKFSNPMYDGHVE